MIADEVNFCPRCGTALITKLCFGRARPICPACGWVFFPDPKVAVAVLILEQNKVLLVRRSNDPRRGLWTLPAGFMDAGEDPARATERECLEETGLMVQVTSLMDVIPGQAHARGADILIVYYANILSGTPQAGDDADKVDFFDLLDLPPLAFSSTYQILARIQPG